MQKIKEIFLRVSFFGGLRFVRGATPGGRYLNNLDYMGMLSGGVVKIWCRRKCHNLDYTDPMKKKSALRGSIGARGALICLATRTATSAKVRTQKVAKIRARRPKTNTYNQVARLGRPATSGSCASCQSQIARFAKTRAPGRTYHFLLICFSLIFGILFKPPYRYVKPLRFASSQKGCP